MPLAYPPLPVARTSYGRPGYQDFAFNLRDPEGMYPRPPGYHGACDWFASGGTPVKAARAGSVVEANPSRGNTGQVFGGTVKVQEPDGTVWVYRHVDPAVGMGTPIAAGQVIAHVTDWRDGPSHCHLEIWKTLAGGYVITNAIDPRSYTFTLVYKGEDKPPPPFGDSLRVVVNGRRWSGWEDASGPIHWIARNGLRSSAKCAIAWRGSIWRGPKAVTNVCRSLERKFL